MSPAPPKSAGIESLPGELNSVYVLTKDACCRYH
jgi:hypothetical protein